MAVEFLSFNDGLISIDKLQKMASNDDYLYNQATGKPRGLVAIDDRVSNYTNGAAPGNDLLFNDLTVTPESIHRLLGVFVFFPNYGHGSGTALDSSVISFVKNGLVVQTGYTDKKFYTGSGDETSFYHGFLDIQPAKVANVYNVQIARSTGAGDQVLTCSTSRPAQFWIEDLGEINV